MTSSSSIDLSVPLNGAQSVRSAAMDDRSLHQGSLTGRCVHCNIEVGGFLAVMTDSGPVHNECIPEYRSRHVERCAHCQLGLRARRTAVSGVKLHPECVADYRSGKAYVAPVKIGLVQKFSVGRSRFGRKNWKDRCLVLAAEYRGLLYFSSEAEALAFRGGSRDARPCGAVMLATPGVRLITKPTFKQHPEVTDMNREIVIVFPEGTKTYRILLRFASFPERQQWIAALEAYIAIVDDPLDYGEVGS